MKPAMPHQLGPLPTEASRRPSKKEPPDTPTKKPKIPPSEPSDPDIEEPPHPRPNLDPSKAPVKEPPKRS